MNDTALMKSRKAMMKSEKAIPLPSWWFRGEMCVWLAVRTKEKRVDGEKGLGAG